MPPPRQRQALAESEDTCHLIPPGAFVAAKLPNFGQVSVTRSNTSRPLNQHLHNTIADLPSEILSQIMCLLLVRSDNEPLYLRKRNRSNSDLIIGVVLIDDEGRPYDTTTTRPLRPLSANINPLLSIILVWKAFYLAGTEAFYSHNTLCYSSLPHFRACGLRGLTDAQKRLVARMRISIRFWPITRLNAPTLHVPWEAQTSWDRAETYLRDQGDVLADGFAERLKEVVVIGNVDLHRRLGGDEEEARASIEQDLRSSWVSRSELVRMEWSSDE